MRLYFAGRKDTLEQLRAGEPVHLDAFEPASDDEQDEFDALTEAAEHGDVAIAADVASPSSPVTVELVASFHLDLDGTGDLAWFAPQELDEVLALLTRGA